MQTFYRKMILEFIERLRFGKFQSYRKAKKLLAVAGININQLNLPDFFNATEKDFENPYVSPSEYCEVNLFKYFRELKIEKIGEIKRVRGEYFAQNTTEYKKDGVWMPGKVYHKTIDQLF